MRLRLLVVLLLAAGCEEHANTLVPVASDVAQGRSLREARKGFKTKLVRLEQEQEAAAPPPVDLFQIVYYDSPAGELVAYLNRPAQDGAKHPAIIWILGGFDNSIGDSAWVPAGADNDQSASAFRQAGIVMMYPSLRGGNLNPGHKEAFFGEVDDVLAAADFLRKQHFVDPKRIYLGGHGTGATLAMLISESSGYFRAVFALGPTDDVTGYGEHVLPFDLKNPVEFELRSPKHWLASIRSPTFVFEGTREPTHLPALQNMAQSNSNPAVQFIPVQDKDHFSVIAPLTRLIANKILDDTNKEANISFPAGELRLKNDP